MSAKSIYTIEQLPKGRTNWAALKKIPEKALLEAAKGDPDAPILTKRELKEFKRVGASKTSVKAIRQKLHFSQDVFASVFGIKVRTLQEWEQGRCRPNNTAKALLTVIEREPRAVMQALGIH